MILYLIGRRALLVDDVSQTFKSFRKQIIYYGDTEFISTFFYISEVNFNQSYTF